MTSVDVIEKLQEQEEGMGSRLVVGVHNGHNAAAAVVRDGALAFALQEERLTRVKNQGGLPKRTLKTIEADYKPSSGIPGPLPIAFGGKNLTQCLWKRDAILASYGNSSCGPVGRMKRLARKSSAISDAINQFKLWHLEEELLADLDGTEPRVTG